MTTVSSGQRLYISASQTSRGVVVQPAGYLFILSGGTAIGTNLSGFEYVESGGVASGTAVGFDGEEYVESGGVASGTVVSDFGIVDVVAGGTTRGTVVSAGVEFVGGITSGTVVLKGGEEDVYSGGVAIGTVVSSGGGEVISSGGTTVNPAIGSGVSLDLLSGAVVSGGISFSDIGGQLQIGGSTMPSNTISGFYPGDTFDLTSIAFDSAGSANLVSSGSVQNQLQITEGGATYELSLDPTQIFTGDFFHLTSDGSGTLVSENTTPCFRRGTLILIERGEVAVEELAIGDKVRTLSGAARPVKWIGRRAYDPRFVAGNRTVLPIRVEAGVLSDGVPARDLWVSPEHALHIDGLLVPARLLINDLTIRQVESSDRLEYFHVELDSHDVILADGAPAETFMDTDNRGMFHNAGEFTALYPDEQSERRELCAPRVEEDAAELTAIRRALLERATALGRTTRDPGLHLIADGDIVHPLSGHDGIYQFAVAASARRVALVSRSAVPAKVYPFSLDGRALGVPVERIVLRDAGLRVEIGHNNPVLGEGFHDDEAALRWSDGRGFLPEGILASFAGDIAVEVHLAATELCYRRYPPALAATTDPGALPSRRQAGTAAA